MGTPTGQVTFLIDGTPAATVALDPATGLASFGMSSIGPGSHSVTVIYTGDSNFLASRSSSSSFVVATASTQSSLTAEAVRNKRGKLTKVILAARVLVVSPGVGLPTGVVTFFRKSKRVATKALVNGTAFLKLKPNQALNKSFTVTYSGDANFNRSGSSKVFPTQKSLATSARPLTAFLNRM